MCFAENKALSSNPGTTKKKQANESLLASDTDLHALLFKRSLFSLTNTTDQTLKCLPSNGLIVTEPRAPTFILKVQSPVWLYLGKGLR